MLTPTLLSERALGHVVSQPVACVGAWVLPIRYRGSSGGPLDGVEVAVNRDSAPPGSRYVNQRPYVAPAHLDELRGPISGTVTLDRGLAWSGAATFDLGNPRRVAAMYEVVLREAGSVVDLVRWIDRSTLVRLWPMLVLPPRLKDLWERRFPELAASRRLTA